MPAEPIDVLDEFELRRVSPLPSSEAGEGPPQMTSDA